MVYLYIPVRTPESFGTGVFFMLKNKSKQTKKPSKNLEDFFAKSGVTV